MDLGLAYFIVGTAVTLIVEFLRAGLKGLDGRLVNLAAWAVGVVATFIPASLVPMFAFEGPDVEKRLMAGAILAGVSSLVAEGKGALQNTRKLRKASLEAIGRGDEAFAPSDGVVARSAPYDQGPVPGDPDYEAWRKATDAETGYTAPTNS